MRCLETAVRGAKYNIEINLEGIKDEKFRDQTVLMSNSELETAVTNCSRVLEILAERKWSLSWAMMMKYHIQMTINASDVAITLFYSIISYENLILELWRRCHWVKQCFCHKTPILLLHNFNPLFEFYSVEPSSQRWVNICWKFVTWCVSTCVTCVTRADTIVTTGLSRDHWSVLWPLECPGSEMMIGSDGSTDTPGHHHIISFYSVNTNQQIIKHT